MAQNGQTPTEIPFRDFGGTDRFRPVAFLGRGSMGVVYRVHDAETGTEVALKTLAIRDPGEIYRLKSEFRSLADVVHRNLVELYELFVDERNCFFTMELIDGSDFIHHVRNGGRPDYARLTGVLRQLVSGVDAIHRDGKLHRDVKPSNVLVTRTGRVVILDFGLVTMFGGGGGAEGVQPELVGTLNYMAPEQAWGAEPNPAADWYSVGVMLYEALTGRVPFEGPAARMLADRGRGAPPAPANFEPSVPPDLGGLVVALLDPTPGARPDAEDILARLAHPAPHGPRRERLPQLDVNDVPFVGRLAELAQLQQAFDGVAKKQPSTVLIEGPSGIGKSELVRRFLRGVESQGRAVVLDGRCHPYEAVPYKALDGVVDRLSRYLLTLPDTTVDALLPRHTEAVAKLFPVLARVPALAARCDRDHTAEPYEVRRRGFTALRELLGRVAEREALVVWVDDLQWGDADSAVLLRELLAPPDSPAMLLVLSYRGEDRDSAPLANVLKTCAGDLPAERVCRLPLSALSTGEAHDLAARLCEDSRHQRIAAITSEAQGSPFLVAQLARHAAAQPMPDGELMPMALHLHTLLAERIEGLGAVAQDILELVSIAGRPLDRSVALDAAGIGEPGRHFVARLEREGLLRMAPRAIQPAVEMYHDRIREVIVAQVPPQRLRTRHRQLAETIERQPAPDPEALLRHFLGADERERAGEWAVRAADRAASVLAFDRAAQLYEQALDLRAGSDERPGLLAKLAEALGNAGRGLQAAHTFEAAAQGFSAQSGERERVLDLRRQAAEHYLRTGHLEEGLAVTRNVLRAVGVTFPRSAFQALTAILVRRAKLTWRGLAFRPRARDEIPPAVLLRLRACHRVSMSLGVVDLLAADAIGVQHLVEALDWGERSQICQALEWEAIKNVQAGGTFLRRRGLRLLERAKELAAETGDPYDLVGVHFASGAAAYEAAEWRQAHQHCDRAATLAREQCTGLRFELVTMDAFSLSALTHMGELREVARRLPQALGDAEERNDLYATLGLRAGVLNFVWLAEDRPGEARQQIDNAIARWPARAFLLQHYLHLIAAVHTDLYTGDVWAAWRRLLEQWPKLRKALFLTMASPAIELRNLRARAALAAAAADPVRLPDGAAPPDPQWSRARLLGLAEKEARRLERLSSVASAHPFAILIRAGIAALTERGEVAAQLYATAADDFARIEMGLYRTAAEYRRAGLVGGDAGLQLQQQAVEWMRHQSVLNPARMAHVVCPVAGALT